jgi:uncharacterized protein (DUF952 family)
MQLIKILRACEWACFEKDGMFRGSPDDLRDGFIHLSMPEQVEGTLARHFADERPLVLAELALADDPALRFEPARNGGLYPHLYRPLAIADIAAMRWLDQKETG